MSFSQELLRKLVNRQWLYKPHDLRQNSFGRVRAHWSKEGQNWNGGYITTKGKGTAVITTSLGLKTIPDVLYAPDIDQNLLSVGQLIEKGYKFPWKISCVLFMVLLERRF